MSEVNYSQLKAQSGASDKSIRNEAQRKLLQYFDLAPEKSSETAKTIDMVEMFDRFPVEMKMKMLNNLVGIQLTEGCNGQCAFCLFGSKKGVESKFSFSSIQEFLKQNYGQIRGEGSSVSQYWDSDPFDYQDGEHNYLDVYHEWRKYFPSQFVGISTTIPKGSVEQFIEFTDRLFNKHVNSKNYPNEIKDDDFNVRISVGRHNLQRVEAVFKELKERWKAKGYTEDAIQAYLTAHYKFSPRLEDDILPLGSQIEKHDDFEDSTTPACEDGVIITPARIECVSMTAPTIYVPSGQYSYEITPDSPSFQIPHFISNSYYQGFRYKEHLTQRVAYDQVLFPLVTRRGSNSEEINLPDPVDDMVFKMGRYCFSLASMISDISELDSKIYAKNSPEEVRKKYLQLCTLAVSKEKSKILSLITKATNHFTREGDQATKDKLNYYARLLKVNLAKAEYISNLISEGADQSMVAIAALALSDVNKNNVDSLPEVLKNLAVAHDRSNRYTKDEKITAIKSASELLGHSGDQSPKWAKIIGVVENS
ncbi:MAG: hypothetical protein UW42_C0054G0005 [Candidatus Collierbacteria bacterium GW2011_GWB1_44_197]|nr:MAG: hypothetical protein UW42_C0054G0005 [Candidatus Collierbacteria bacterium GW2011_GWB1_44_197]KKT63706.1 MAG: hypothetical protein UW58_C0053G0005 [Candidatus Collierbacteria bacterium GW2011_GWC2_44_30]